MSTCSSRLAARKSLLPPNISGYNMSKGMRRHLRDKIPAARKAEEERAHSALLQKRQLEPAAPAKAVVKKTETKTAVSESKAAPVPNKGWTCVAQGAYRCRTVGTDNSRFDDVCWLCGAPRVDNKPTVVMPKVATPASKIGPWICRSHNHEICRVIGTHNMSHDLVCYFCGASRP